MTAWTGSGTRVLSKTYNGFTGSQVMSESCHGNLGAKATYDILKCYILEVCVHRGFSDNAAMHDLCCVNRLRIRGPRATVSAVNCFNSSMHLIDENKPPNHSHIFHTTTTHIYIVTVYVYLNVCVLGDISNIPCISCMYVLCAICIEDIFVLHIYYI
jgi:hypothetical protein